MRIEILIDGSVDPQIYPINKPKLTLGSGETCDVVISNENISRKHLIIVNEGDSFYVIDQGSTNGSFINEERLVPGRRTEFTSFFPVRLGDQVLITLLSEDDQGAGSDEPVIPLFGKERAAQTRGDDDSTRLISLADLKKAKTSDLVQRRNEVIKKKSTPPKKLPPKSKRKQENARFKLLVWVSAIAIGGIGYYNFQGQKEEKRIAKIGEVVMVEVTNAAKDKKPEDLAGANAVPSPDEIRLIPDEQLLDKNRYLPFLNDAKCVTDIEKYFCEKIPGASVGLYGAIQIGTTIHIIIDGEPYIKEAREYVNHPTPDANGNVPSEIYEPYKKTVMNAAVAIFFMRGIPADMDWEKIKELKIVVGIYETWQGTTYIQMVGAGYPERIKKFREIITVDNLKNIKVVGENALIFTKDYYKTY